MRHLLIGLVGVLGLGLTGCTGTPSMGSPTQASGPATAEATSSEQAKSVWDAYYAAYTRILADPQTPIATVQPYLTSAEYDAVKSGISNFVRAGYVVRGPVSNRNFRVVEHTSKPVGLLAVVCVDNEQSQIYDDEGRNVTPAGRTVDVSISLKFLKVRGAYLIDYDSVAEASAC